MYGFFWKNPPQQYTLEKSSLSFATLPHTDFWQRTHYGFQNDSGHCYLKNFSGDFTLSFRAQFFYNGKYDQCGLMVYADIENWCKGSIELINQKTARLGSVFTKMGWSDWASTDIPNVTYSIYYRIHRRNDDFLLEQSPDGNEYFQLRMFHMHLANPDIAAGLYACSPLDSSFTASFSELNVSSCLWGAE